MRLKVLARTPKKRGKGDYYEIDPNATQTIDYNGIITSVTNKTDVKRWIKVVI